MSERTGIEWTEATWNPVTGCDRVSEGCDHCYALDLAARLKAMGNPRYQRDGAPPRSGPGFGVTLHPDKLTAPLRWRKPRRVFVNSMSDLFHDEVPDEFIADVFAVMALSQDGEPRRAPHIYQVLTKRPGRMASLLRSPGFDRLVFDARSRLCSELGTDGGRVYTPWRWGPIPNVWLGVSVETQKWADARIPKLLETPAAVRFLSCEPLLGPLKLGRWLVPVECGACGFLMEDWSDTDQYRGRDGVVHSVCPVCGTDGRWEPAPSGLHWVIVGGESGRGARPMHPEWVIRLRNQCQNAAVPFFFKQWGSWAGGEHVSGDRAEWVDLDGARRPFQEAGPAPGRIVMHYCSPSSKAGGRELQGMEWNEMPEPAGGPE